jgi:hypothetical protein
VNPYWVQSIVNGAPPTQTVKVLRPSHDSTQLDGSAHPGATQPLPASPVVHVSPALEQS